MDKRITHAGIRKKEGMTLIEVMIAMAVLSIVVVAFFALSGTTITGIFNAGSKSQATADANEKHDQVYFAVTSAATSAAAETAMKALPGWRASAAEIDATAGSPQFYYQKTSAAVEGVTVNGYVITVIVYYQNGKFKVEQESFVYKST